MDTALLRGQICRKSPCSPFKSAVRRFQRVCLPLIGAIILSIVGSKAGRILIATAAPNFTGCGGEQVTVVNADFEAQVAELVNIRRAEQGLPPMKLVDTLGNAARYHAADLRQDHYFDHDTYDRINGDLAQVCAWYERILVYYPSPRAENIASGYTSPESVMADWMNSASHRPNILGNNRELGVGFYENRWVQDFGTRSDVYPLLINAEARQTDTFDVTLYIYGTWQEMRLRNDADAWGEWIPFSSETDWTLNAVAGLRTVEVELRSGAKTATSSDSIELTTGEAPAPTPTPTPPPPVNLDLKTFLPMVER